MSTIIKNPPGPRHRFLGANASARFFTDTLGYIIEKQKKYGDIVLLKASSHHMYVINNLEYVDKILVKNHKDFTKGTGYQRARVILGNGILTSEGEFHDSQRKLISPSFHRNRIKEYYEIVAECTKDMMNDWNHRLMQNNRFDIETEMTKLFISIICRSLFSIDSKKDIIETGELFTKIFQNANSFFLLNPELALKLPIPSARRFKDAKNRFDGLIKNVISKRKKSNIPENLDILSKIMHSNNTSGKELTDDELFDEILTLFVAANDTSAKVMTWTLFLLSQHENESKLLESEIKEILGGRFPGFDDYEKLKYAAMVVNESMRLYPPVWMILRKPINDFYLDEYFIRNDSSIFILPYIIHRNEKYYELPEKFIPERWTDEQKKSRPRLSFIPFGAGPRICIGESFSMFHLVIILSAVIQNFNFRLHPKQKVAFSSSITLKPKYGMNMIMEKK